MNSALCLYGDTSPTLVAATDGALGRPDPGLCPEFRLRIRNGKNGSE